MKKLYVPNRLFAGPSFLEGVARVLDVGVTLQEYNEEAHPDVNALKNDWRAVGDDLKSSLTLYERTLATAA